jgi:dynein heavy chain
VFDQVRARLPGDAAVASAFCVYCGPLDAEGRAGLVEGAWAESLDGWNLPWSSENFDLTGFLANAAVVRAWAVEGLPRDARSVENGLLVTRARKWPLMVDPQGQGARWVLAHEQGRLPTFRSTTLGDQRLRERLEFCLTEGLALLVTDVGHGHGLLAPLLGPLLDKALVVKAKASYVSVGGRLCEAHPAFALYLATRNAQPAFPPPVNTHEHTPFL